MNPSVAKTVFLNYAREDGDQADILVQNLTSRGLTVWFDRESIPGGANWRNAIRSGIEKSDVFLALQSSTSVGKRGTVQREIRLALDIMKECPEDLPFIIPVRLDDCVLSPRDLRDLHRVDLFPDWDDGISRLVASILPDAGPKAPLYDVLNSTIDAAAVHASKYGVIVDKRFGTEKCNVGVPPTQAKVIFSNLILNAIKFTDAEGNPRPAVEIKTKISAANVVVSIANVGHGIAYADIQRIFEFGYTSDANSTGLGLPIVRKASEMIGWDVTVTSVPILRSGAPNVMRRNYRTVFTVHVPGTGGRYSAE